MRVVAVLVWLTGCHALFGLDHVQPGVDDGQMDADAVSDAAPDAALACSHEMFDLALAGRWTAYGDTNCGASVANSHGRLQIDANSDCYTEMHWPTSRIVTGSTITVEVVNAGIQAQNVQMYVLMKLDPTNWVFFNVANLNISLGKRVMDSNEDVKTLAYDPAQMAYWRFVQLPATDTFELYTGTGMPGGWTRRHSVQVPFAHQPLILLLGAGTFSGGVATENIVEFDNVSVCDP
jgi:hypothetical protein